MAVRRFVWRACYQALAKRVSTPDWAFTNYGYVPASIDVGRPPLRSSDEPDRLCIQLYLHAIDSCDLRDSDVLEVGSGRGGGASYSPEAADFCNRHRRAPGLAFIASEVGLVAAHVLYTLSWLRVLLGLPGLYLVQRDAIGGWAQSAS